MSGGRFHRGRAGRPRRPWAGALLAVLMVAVWLGRARSQEVDRLDVPSPDEAVYTPLVYPVRAAHGLHAQQIECARCHPGAAASSSSADDLLPTMAQCGECHAQASDTQDPEACSLCHPGYRPAWPEGGGFLAVRDPRFPLVGPEPVVRRQPNLIFSHAQHADTACATCHPSQQDGGASLPAMALCLDCHRSSGAPTGCPTCHPTGADGRLVTDVPGTLRTPEARLVPRDHDQDWAVGHGLAAGLDAAACMSCHTEDDCRRCHDGSLAVGSIHPPGFVSHHSAEARRNQPACGSCHVASSFCFDCHADAHLLDDDSHRPPAGTTIHPLGWVDPGGGTHATEAQQDLIECAGCHAESDCVACHQTVNPHGAEFLSRCRGLLDADPGVCERCHTDVAALAGSCQ